MSITDGCDAELEKRVRDTENAWEATCYCDLRREYNKQRRRVPWEEVVGLLEGGSWYGVDQVEYRAMRN